MKVYIVEYDDGNYDGRVNTLGIFSTEENARKFISKYGEHDREHMDVIDYDVDSDL